MRIGEGKRVMQNVRGLQRAVIFAKTGKVGFAAKVTPVRMLDSRPANSRHKRGHRENQVSIAASDFQTISGGGVSQKRLGQGEDQRDATDIGADHGSGRHRICFRMLSESLAFPDDWLDNLLRFGPGISGGGHAYLSGGASDASILRYALSH